MCFYPHVQSKDNKTVLWGHCGLASKCACHWGWQPLLIPGTHMAEGENRLLKTVHWPLTSTCVPCFMKHPPLHTYMFWKRFSFIYFVLCVWMFVCMFACAWGACCVLEAKKRAWDHPRTGVTRLWAVTWVLRTKPESSRRAISTLGHCAIFMAH